MRIRAWRPDATGVVALIGDDRVTLTKIDPAGLLEVVLPRSDIPAYRLEVAYGDRSFTIDDPYRFWPTIGELDQYLLGEGRHERLWQKLGAHERTLDGVAGTSFAVWAPNARAVEWRRGPIALVAANLYVFAFGMSWGPVVWVMLGEKFPNRIRAAALGVAAAAQWIANWLISTTFPALSDIGLGLAYGIYTAAAILSFFFVVRFVSETKGKELEEMRV